jgi:hypothetical protein
MSLVQANRAREIMSAGGCSGTSVAGCGRLRSTREAYDRLTGFPAVIREDKVGRRREPDKAVHTDSDTISTASNICILP